jgi:hypothetical protein
LINWFGVAYVTVDGRCDRQQEHNNQVEQKRIGGADRAKQNTGYGSAYGLEAKGQQAECAVDATQQPLRDKGKPVAELNNIINGTYHPGKGHQYAQHYKVGRKYVEA